MKKFVSMLVLFLLVINSSVYAYDFPQPDWGALLREREKMVNTSELELYVEGNINSAPYYGAKLEPRGGTYIGMIAESSDGFKPLGSYLTYIDGMYQNDFYYPANSMIRQDNIIPMVGWSISNINNVDYDKISDVLDTLSKYNKPMFIRFANEMNESTLGNDPDKYVEVFRTVADMIHDYPNFAVVWSPIDLGSLDRPFEYFYPGDEYVDWVGLSCYSIEYFLGNQNTKYKDSVYFMTGNYAWATNRVKPFMEFLEKNNINKPVMISEGGVTTNTRYGDDCESWATPRLRNMLWYLNMKYPQIKMINYFNTHRANENEKFDISDYQYAVDIFNEAAGNGAYIREANGTPKFVFQPANDAGTLTAKGGIVNLYTLAYFANEPSIMVNYRIDDNWYHSANQIPYICKMNIADITDGQHTLTIEANGMTNNYTFYKTGQCISFNVEPDSAVVELADQNNTNTDIMLMLNDRKLDFDQPPIIIDGRTLVPLRAIFEALGATVEWNGETQTVTSKKGSTNISLSIDSKTMYKNGKSVMLDVPAQLISDRTLVPARAVAEAFGCDVEWDSDTKTVTITN